jgi:transmembrane sensor
MKHQEDRPLADDVAMRVDPARLARQWSAVSSALAKRPGRRFFVVLAPAALALLLTIALLIARPWQSGHTGSVVATTGRASQVTVLPDGSRITLSSGAELALESATRERVHVILGAGAIDLDVTHVAGRPFVVSAAGHDVTVLGTAFSVKLAEVDGERTLAVEVTRGRVRVTGPTGEHVLEAGQAWSARVGETAGAEPAPVASPTTAEAADDAPSPAPVAEPSARPAAPAVPVEGPRELLARATDARSKGKPRDAAVALDTLRKRYRSDARAGLAAFELGRVRMDALADPAGAAEAFADAIALAPSAPFREDAEARRVEALDALPDRSRCEHARDAYLTRYPSGLHTKQIALRCKRP